MPIDISEGEDKESSSDWSSSDEDDEEGDDDPLRLSTHSALQAQWEWRTMADSLPDNKLVNNLPPFSITSYQQLKITSLASLRSTALSC